MSVVSDNKRDFGQEQVFSYGMRAGLWRFLDAFDMYDCKTTFFMCGRAVERVPDLAGEVVQQGHEPACHAWRWQAAPTTVQLKKNAKTWKIIDVISAATGRRPVGFSARQRSLHRVRS